MAHTRTNFLSADGQLIGYSTQAKYLLTGKWWLDMWATKNPPWMSAWQSKLADILLPSPSGVTSIQAGAHELVDSNLCHIAPGHAEFKMINEHKNPFGALHGGCVAMVMEKTADRRAKDLLRASNGDTR